MNQVLPVLFFAWVNSHRTAAARVGDAMYFHVRDLPHFRDHLNDYLDPPAPSCRKGVHRDPGSAMDEIRQSISGPQGDPAVSGTPAGDRLHKVSFGTGVEWFPIGTGGTSGVAMVTEPGPTGWWVRCGYRRARSWFTRPGSAKGVGEATGNPV